MRTFLAIEFNDEARRIIARLQEPLAKIEGIRLTRPESCHLTLKFLGEIDERQREEFVASLRGIRVPAFPLALTQLGAFPNARRPRILWVGVTHPPELASLAHAVDRATSAIALDKPFAPHVTIARCKQLGARFDEQLLEQRSPECAIDVREFVLYRSSPGAGGSHYEAIEKFTLEPAIRE